MIAPAEGLADRRQRGAGQVASQVDGDLARPGDRVVRLGEVSCSTESLKWAATIAWTSSIEGGPDRRRTGYIASRTSRVRAWSIGPLRERVECDDADERALERADVVGDAVGDELEYGRIGERDVVERGALAQDGDAGGVVGRHDVGDQAGLEALAESLLDRDERARKPVAGEHELAPGLVQRVEGVEELLFGAGLAGQELDVVDQEDVGVAVGVLEGAQGLGAERADEVVGEGLGRRVADRGAAAEVQDVVADRVQQVRLAEPGRRVEEQRVVGLAGDLGDGQRGGVGQAVALADDELLEAVAGVELGGLAVGSGASAGGLRGVPARCRRRRRGCGRRGPGARSAPVRGRTARSATSPSLEVPGG